MARQSVEVHLCGILPDLFREGQGVVTLGTLRPDGSFRASEVLAKHDETYMPQGRRGRAEDGAATGTRAPARRRRRRPGTRSRRRPAGADRMMHRRIASAALEGPAPFPRAGGVTHDPELGHFALALAVALAAAQAVLPLLGRARARRAADGGRRRRSRSASSSRSPTSYGCLVWSAVVGRLLGAQHRREQPAR